MALAMRLRSRRRVSASPKSSMSFSRSMCAYHTSRVRWSAKSIMRLRYDRTLASAASRMSPLLKSLLRGDHEARGEPFHVPFPGRGQRLVEVVDVEGEAPLRRGEAAKIEQVAVAARLDMKPGGRRLREIRGHDRRCPPKEGEGGLEHAAPAYGDQLRRAPLVRGLEEDEGIRAVARLRPLAVAPARAALTKALALREDLLASRHDRSPRLLGGIPGPELGHVHGLRWLCDARSRRGVVISFVTHPEHPGRVASAVLTSM